MCEISSSLLFGTGYQFNFFVINKELRRSWVNFTTFEIIAPEGKISKARHSRSSDRRYKTGLTRRSIAIQCHERSLFRALTKDKSVGPESPPAFLSGSIFITIIDCHPESELHPTFKRIKLHGFFRQFNFIDRPLCVNVAGNKSGRAAHPCFFKHHLTAQVILNSTKRIIIKCDLRVLLIVGDHELNRVAIPRAVSGVFVIFIRN